MTIAMSKTREQFPLSTKKVLKKTITSTLVYIILFLVIYVSFVLIFFSFAFSIGNLGLITFGILGLLMVIIAVTYFYQLWYYNVYFYDLTEDYIVIKKGPITPHEITVPYERVQDVYVDQDIFDRLFGLYDVHLSSATAASGESAHIDGVEKPAADGLRSLLLQKVSEKIGKNRNASLLS